MNRFLQKIPGYQEYKPGLEAKVLNEFPLFTLLGLLAIALPSYLARLVLSNRGQRIVDILVIGTEIFFRDGLDLSDCCIHY